MTVAISIAGLFGVAPEREQPMGAEIPQVVALFETTLAVKITSTGTEMTLTSGTDKDGNTLSGFYGFIIDEGTASEEFVTASTTGTVAEDLTRGISVVTGNTEISGLKKAHRRGASVKITNHPVLAVLARIMNGDEFFPNTLKYASSPTFASSTAIVDKNYCDTTFVGLTGNQTIAGLKTFSTIPRTSTSTPTVDTEVLTKYTGVMVTGDQTIAGIKTFSSFPFTPSSAPTSTYQVANKKYIDDIAIAGAGDATLTLQGLVEMATDTEVKSGNASGTTGAYLFVNPSDMATNYVNASSTQTIKGVKTFESIPLSPTSTPGTDTGLTSKYYVDSLTLSVNGSTTAVAVIGGPASATTTLEIGFQPSIIFFFIGDSNAANIYSADGFAFGTADHQQYAGASAAACFKYTDSSGYLLGKIITFASTSVLQLTEVGGDVGTKQVGWVAIK